MALLPGFMLISFLLAILGVATNTTELLYVATGMSASGALLPVVMLLNDLWSFPPRRAPARLARAV